MSSHQEAIYLRPPRACFSTTITALLHILLWISTLKFFASVFLISADPGDSTMVPAEVLDITSSTMSICYVILHSLVAHKQGFGRDGDREKSTRGKITYATVRLVIASCILWLLSAGWHVVIASRQPTCLPADSGRASWESGSTCIVSRIGTAMSFIALTCAAALFYFLATSQNSFKSNLLGSYSPSKRPQETLLKRSSAAGSKEMDPNASLALYYPPPNPPFAARAGISTLTETAPIGLGIMTPSPPNNKYAPMLSEKVVTSHRAPLRPSATRRRSSSGHVDAAWRALNPTAAQNRSKTRSSRSSASTTAQAPSSTRSRSSRTPYDVVSVKSDTSRSRSSSSSSSTSYMSAKSTASTKSTSSTSSSDSSGSSVRSSINNFCRSPLSSMRRASAPDIEILPDRWRRRVSDDSMQNTYPSKEAPSSMKNRGRSGCGGEGGISLSISQKVSSQSAALPSVTSKLRMKADDMRLQRHINDSVRAFAASMAARRRGLIRSCSAGS